MVLLPKIPGYVKISVINLKSLVFDHSMLQRQGEGDEAIKNTTKQRSDTYRYFALTYEGDEVINVVISQ